MAGQKHPGLIGRFVAWLIGLFFDGLRHDAKVEAREELRREQGEAADAQADAFDRIDNDSRTHDDAIAGLRERLQRGRGEHPGEPPAEGT